MTMVVVLVMLVVVLVVMLVMLVMISILQRVPLEPEQVADRRHAPGREQVPSIPPQPVQIERAGKTLQHERLAPRARRTLRTCAGRVLEM